MDSAGRTEQFLALYNRQQGKVYAFIRTLVPNRNDAEEVFQETCIALWKAFDQFEAGSDFAAWSRQVARHRVLAFFKEQQRDRHRFAAEVMEQIADDVEEYSPALAARRTALKNCLAEMPAEDREIVERRYAGGMTTVKLAEELDRPVNTLYKALARNRRRLQSCIQRKLRAEGEQS